MCMNGQTIGTIAIITAVAQVVTHKVLLRVQAVFFVGVATTTAPTTPVLPFVVPATRPAPAAIWASAQCLLHSLAGAIGFYF